MKLKNTLGIMMVALAFAFTVSAVAKTKNSGGLVLYGDASVAGSHLASGKYQVSWETHSPGVTVTFQQGKKVVATAEAKIVDRGRKFVNGSVVFTENADGSRAIQEIHFAGSSEVIVFKE